MDNRASGQKIFDYVDPRNRASQIEMEQACTAHLKEIGGYLEPVFEPVELTAGGFANSAVLKNSRVPKSKSSRSEPNW